MTLIHVTTTQFIIL